MQLTNEMCTVEISIDKEYHLESVDNQPYDIEFNPRNLHRSDMHRVFAIKVDMPARTVNIALVGDFYSYEADCALLEKNILTVLSGQMIVQIDVEAAKIVLFKEFECFGCNYGIYKVTDGYLIYGDIEITMLDNDFNKQWGFIGKDVFVSVGGKRLFTLENDAIRLYDFAGNYYEIDYDGNLISNSNDGEENSFQRIKKKLLAGTVICTFVFAIVAGVLSSFHYHMRFGVMITSVIMIFLGYCISFCFAMERGKNKIMFGGISIAVGLLAVMIAFIDLREYVVEIQGEKYVAVASGFLSTGVSYYEYINPFICGSKKIYAQWDGSFFGDAPDNLFEAELIYYYDENEQRIVE